MNAFFAICRTSILKSVVQSVERRVCRVAIVLALAAAPTAALGQSYYYPSPAYPFGPFYQPVQPWPAGLCLGYHRHATAPGDILWARSAWLYGLGSYQISAAQSAILWEQARWLNMANDWQRIVYFQARRELRERRSEAERQVNLARRLGTYRAAYELSPFELNPFTGDIEWPAILQHSQFDESRLHLEALLRSYFYYNDTSESTAVAIAREAKRLIEDLRRNSGNLDRAQYLAAQRFLRGVEFAPEFAGRTARS